MILQLEACSGQTNHKSSDFLLISITAGTEEELGMSGSICDASQKQCL
jgi:hypothetical protein